MLSTVTKMKGNNMQEQLSNAIARITRSRSSNGSTTTGRSTTSTSFPQRKTLCVILHESP